MTQQLETVFGELGICQYLDAFIDQGFDTWETILDITESDLNALGVKLGHRRKLQRRIANTRGVARDAALLSPSWPSIEDPRLDGHRQESVKPENGDSAKLASATRRASLKVESTESGPAVTAKRKYRRHPKTDENAPERPPSAYVLFSNKMREDLRDRILTFTEIAKLVGENWQNLSQSEREPFETQAQAAKEKFNQDMSDYKKTNNYKAYMTYVEEFKAKHCTPVQDKDVSKRVKLSDTGNASSSGTPHSARSGTSSGSEPPPTLDQRVSSGVSGAEALYSNAMSPGSHHASGDDSLSSPTGNHIDSEPSPPPLGASPRDGLSSQPGRLISRRAEGQRAGSASNQRNLPPLSDMFDGRSLMNGIAAANETNGFSAFVRSRQNGGSPGPAPGLVGGESRPPSLRHEYSSAGSSASSFSFPRTPIEGSLPIHALLSGKSSGAFDSTRRSTSPDTKIPALQYPHDQTNGDQQTAGTLTNGAGYFSSPPPMSGASPTPSHHHHLTNGFGPTTAATTTITTSGAPKRKSPPSSNGATGGGSSDLDGMAALLKAGELFDRHTR